jgi:exonuclease III
MDHTTNNNNRLWKVLCWNGRGINSQQKWSAIRSKINETGCDIVCLEETKRENLDDSYLKNFWTASFDNFEYVPSVGQSGGTLVIWKGSRFNGAVIFQTKYAMNIEFSSNISNDVWILSNIYAPCMPEGKHDFLEWLHNIDMPDDTNWLLVGDFNLIRHPSDRNRPGGNVNEMLQFNTAISNLRLGELRLNENRFTWTNK